MIVYVVSNVESPPSPPTIFYHGEEEEDKEEEREKVEGGSAPPSAAQPGSVTGNNHMHINRTVYRITVHVRVVVFTQFTGRSRARECMGRRLSCGRDKVQRRSWALDVRAARVDDARPGVKLQRPHSLTPVRGSVKCQRDRDDESTTASCEFAETLRRARNLRTGHLHPLLRSFWNKSWSQPSLSVLHETQL